METWDLRVFPLQSELHQASLLSPPKRKKKGFYRIPPLKLLMLSVGKARAVSSSSCRHLLLYSKNNHVQVSANTSVRNSTKTNHFMHNFYIRTIWRLPRYIGRSECRQEEVCTSICKSGYNAFAALKICICSSSERVRASMISRPSKEAR